MAQVALVLQQVIYYLFYMPRLGKNCVGWERVSEVIDDGVCSCKLVHL
jgi:hypothetical protein